MAIIPISRISFGMWQIVDEVQLTSDTTSINFTGLSGDTDKYYQLMLKAVIPSSPSGSRTIQIRFNNSTTNYSKLEIQATSAGVGSLSSSTPPAMVTEQSKVGQLFAFICSLSGSDRIMQIHSFTDNLGAIISITDVFWSGSGEVTSIDIVSDKTMGSGTHAILSRWNGK